MRALEERDGSFPPWLSAPSLGALKTTTLRQKAPLISGNSGEVKMDSMENSTTVSYNYDENLLDPNVSVDNSSKTDSLSLPNVIALVIYVAVFLVGVPGNALVVWVTGSEAKRAINAIWFLNLAVADLLSCLALPISFATLIQHDHWFLDNTACRILPSLILLNMYASILILATISADRFLLVFNPIWCQNYRGAYLAWMACGVAWGLALLLTLPSFIYHKVHREDYPPKVQCVIDYGKDGIHKHKGVAVFRLVMGFLWPLVVLTVCYTFLLIRTWSRRATRSTKTLKVVMAVVISFFVFWLPYQVTGIILVFLPDNKVVSSLDALCVSIAYINCCINPIIYVVAAQGFHTRFLKSLPSKLQNILTEESMVRESKSFTLSTVDNPSHKNPAV